MNIQTIINGIKMLASSERKALSQKLRSNTNAWNAINGLGDVTDENLANGVLKGIIKEGDKLLKDTTVEIEKDGKITQCISDENGEYIFDIDPGKFKMTASNSGYYDTIINDIEVLPETETIINVEMTRNNQ